MTSTQRANLLCEDAWKALESGALQEAYQISMRLVAQHQGFPRGWFVASRVAQAMRNSARALEYSEQSVSLDPDNAAFLVQYANCLLAANRRDEASKLAKRAEKRAGNSARLLAAIGGLYSELNEYAQALPVLEKAVVANPKNAHYCFNLALARQALGDLRGAETMFDCTIELSPDDYEAYLHRSRLRKQTTDQNHIHELESLLASTPKTWRGEVLLRFALAKELEDVGLHDQSFRALNRGSRLRRMQMQYDSTTDLAVIDSIIESYSAEVITSILGKTSQSAAVTGPSSIRKRPIFIVGLPRTGTTLIERILGCHPDVFAAGELNDFALQLSSIVNAIGGQSINPRQQLVRASTTMDFSKLGTAYLESTHSKTKGSRIFTDKLPLNFLYVGLIHLALPSAKIIHITRDPMDSCYAIYKTHFKQAYPFSYDLEELGRYFVAYRKLMSHWTRVVPRPILDVRYEDLVHDQEATSRQVYEFCELEWHSDYLDFHSSPDSTVTASAAQVREPVYQSSVGQWRVYRQQLEPLRDLLMRAGVTVDDV